MNVKITCYPLNWPTDKRSFAKWEDGRFILRHPERPAHEYDLATRKWKEVERKAA